ncbi:MAG: VWA domain-containing protein [Myxococcales bacterium]|nr:VWA domain-containing protein [Myxococcales bacterium]
MFACSPTGGGGPDRDGGRVDGDTDTPPLNDADGDGISDEWEGRSLGTDTDGDGIPDYLDLDSDNDGIPDSVERVRGGNETPPIDSDGDGIYDFRDLDSDNNGMPDEIEGTADADGDGTPDYRDLDDDNDTLPDSVEIGDPAAPSDYDGDGLWDFRDFDSDNDTIGDRFEAIPPPDTDGDGILDRFDLDSDNDGWPDIVEAGPPGRDPTSAPVDTDGDGIPDFRDTDSDGDGLSDADELRFGTSRTNPDTDGDGVPDLIEIGSCAEGDTECYMDALDPTRSPRTRGDFVFLEPYMLPPDPPRDTLIFSTNLQSADVYFLIDTTGSMGGAINNVRSSLSTAGTGIIDRVRAEIPDTAFGVGGFDDYQCCGYGDAGSGDRAYYHLAGITPTASTVQAAVNGMVTHYGADTPESLVPAIWATVTGNGLAGPSGWPSARTDCPAGHFGWPCFRPGAVPILVAITDAPSHNGTIPAYNYGGAAAVAPSFADTVAQAVARNVRIIGVSVGGGGLQDLQALATMTGAVDGAGAPLVSTAASGAVSAGVVDQIRTLANSTPITISAIYEDDPSDAVDTTTAFVAHLVVNNGGGDVMGRTCTVFPADRLRDTNGSGHADTIDRVTPGQPVCFDIVVRQNDTVEPTRSPQVFRGTIRVMGDGFTELDRRDVYFLVPPVIPPPDGPM